MSALKTTRDPRAVRLVEIERALARSRRAGALRAVLACAAGAAIALESRPGLALVLLALAVFHAVVAYRRRALRRCVRRADDDVIRRSGIYRVRD